MPTVPQNLFGACAGVIQGSFRGGRPALAVQARTGPGARAVPGTPPRTVPGVRPGVPKPAPVAQPFRNGSVFPVPPTINFAPRGAGQPLPPAVLQKMEGFFGTSFSDVRVHVGPQAASIGALAFTMGSDLYFAPGQYDPHSAQGQRLLGHELTHVVQQRAGRVRNPLGGGVAVVQDPALEAEAERMGMRVGTVPAGAAVQARMPGARPEAVQPRRAPGRGGAAQAYRVQPPVQGPNGRMQIRATLPGAAGRAGSVNVRPTRSGLLEITDLYVAPEYRQRGLGKRLMQAALKAARSQGLRGAVLEARPTDAGISAPALQAMYERMAFHTVGMSARGSPIMELRCGAASPRGGARIQPRMGGPGVGRAARPAGSRGVVQRATPAKTSIKVGDLTNIAQDVNQANSGKSDSRNTQAMVKTSDGKFFLFTQREYSAFDSEIESAESKYGIVISERVIGDNRKEDEGIHAEMLAVSWWIQGYIEKPAMIGVSQGICTRCKAVLDILKIKSSAGGGQTTQNWVHPYRHAGIDASKVPVKLKELPQKVTKGKEYGW